MALGDQQCNIIMRLEYQCNSVNVSPCVCMGYRILNIVWQEQLNKGHWSVISYSTCSVSHDHMLVALYEAKAAVLVACSSAVSMVES